MKALAILASLAVLLAVGSSAPAEELTSIPRSAEIALAPNQVFGRLKNYLSDTTRHQFELVSADQAAGTIVAKRNGIDPNTWNDWAFCKVSGVSMLQTLDNGAVTVRVRLRRDAAKKTTVTVTSDFEGSYGGLGEGQHTVRCQSKGALENGIIASAGPQQPESSEEY